jgi:hypothetical protein
MLAAAGTIRRLDALSGLKDFTSHTHVEATTPWVGLAYPVFLVLLGIEALLAGKKVIQLYGAATAKTHNSLLKCPCCLNCGGTYTL